jgi:hypothetical protein
MTNNTNSVKGGAMSKIDPTVMTTRDRRYFIGGSDARVIMGKKLSYAFGEKSEVRLPMLPFPAN